MSKKTDIRDLIAAGEPFQGFVRVLASVDRTIHLDGMTVGALTSYAAAMVKKGGGVHVFVAENRDAAAYWLNDFYSLMGEPGTRKGEASALFFPTSTRQSIIQGTEDAQGVVQRTAALAALRRADGGDGLGDGLVICTYPEALVERVADPDAMRHNTIALRVDQTISPNELEKRLKELLFKKVDFVYEPGQYSLRGGIVDVFSFSQNRPLRFDFFGDQIESIRAFEISSQLSAEKLERADILPNLHTVSSVTLAAFAGEATWWFADAAYVLRRVDEIRKQALQKAEEPALLEAGLTSAKQLLADLALKRIVALRDNLDERRADAVAAFKTTPQPAFNKNFELLASHIAAADAEGVATYILSENRAQIERLESVFAQTGHKNLQTRPLALTLHEGFADHALKANFYTDHQIFDRYQRYHIGGQIRRDEQLTVAELNTLQVGDYVTHIDHGVGRFGGLVRINENGKMREAIKLVYKDNDVLFVHVHALHRIARYKSGEGEAPKIHKLGSGAWQKLKSTAKRAVKDISRELIALYAKRKASRGFAFSPDGYLQQELEASFQWEDTPDQQSTTEAVKRDMESEQPMDRLVCGDVGFGKTEVAIRAAFKAATDGKQVAVLVPTTILALQHWRTFRSRLKQFPVRVEYLNRSRSAADVKAVLADLSEGKIDIIIGTHKLLGKEVRFHDLGLLIIDEEQKFGVSAKEKLTGLSVSVDTLTLTATPIPRTLQFSLMGSRDLSVISTPPPNRQPIVTESHAFSEELIRDAINAELDRGGQVYFVHNRVEDMMTLKGMITRLCPRARVEVGHGKMPAAELEKRIMEFIYGEFDVLLATTIVENGIDIPNANTIIIDAAQNFGLSDLHQMRGRVGRGDRRAYCYLLTPPDELLTSEAHRRMRAIEEFSDLGSGFNLAMQDLDIRGAGNLLGAEQSGFIADIGFETYQKIMQEALVELRQEGLDVPVARTAGFLSDATIETEVQAELPDMYVAQQAERLRLYRELDGLPEERLDSFESKLRDRFGPLPEEARNLLGIVRLRREAMRLGMEKLKIKNGLLIATLVGDEKSPYYQSDTFSKVLASIAAAPDRFVLKQFNGRLQITVRGVDGLREACDILKSL